MNQIFIPNDEFACIAYKFDTVSQTLKKTYCDAYCPKKDNPFAWHFYFMFLLECHVSE